jgi:N-formylglutamate amidohydrolase
MGLTHMHDTDALPAPYDVASPVRQQVGLVFASPHSGQHYPEDLMAATDLSKLSLSRSADNFVDELFSDAPDHGAPLLRAAYARAYLDLNREPWELDPQMFDEELPDHVNGTSLRVAGGLGTIPRLAADGSRIYRDHLDFAEVRERLNRVYFPYHHCLARMVEDTQLAFGHCVLIDCHSMPSAGGMTPGRGDDIRVGDSGRGIGRDQRADIVLGDRFGTACAPELIDCAYRTLSGLGLRVQRNNPYAGGFTTYHYGRPGTGVHALQIEINRRLYMDEVHVRPASGMTRMRDAMSALISALSHLPTAYFKTQEAAE